MYLLAIATLFSAPADPIAGEATKDRLWLRADQGTVTVYDRASGSMSTAAERVLSTDRSSDGGVMALIARPDAATGSYEFRDIAPLAAVASRFELADDNAHAIVAGKGPLTVLTAKTVMSLEKGSWQAARLTTPPRFVGVVHAAQTADGVLIGSEGGPLYAINRLTGLAREVKVGDTAISNVTAVSNDLTKPDCSLVSVAQAKAGYVARVCGTQAEPIFTKLQKDGSSAPVLGVAATSKGWIAVAGGKVIRESGGKTKESTLAKPKTWKGLSLVTSIPELVLVYVTGREYPIFVPVR